MLVRSESGRTRDLLHWVDSGIGPLRNCRGKGGTKDRMIGEWVALPVAVQHAERADLSSKNVDDRQMKSLDIALWRGLRSRKVGSYYLDNGCQG